MYSEMIEYSNSDSENKIVKLGVHEPNERCSSGV